MRHRAATIFGGQNLPEHIQEMFYQHIGHSKEIDQKIYSAPQGNKTLINLGPKLNRMFHIGKI